EAIQLHQAVDESFKEMMSLSSRDGVRLENRVSADLPPLPVDRELVGRVLANLLNNALKHTPTGGLVAVEARREGEEIIITVSDTGEGIPEDLQPYIFEKFVAGESVNSRRMLYDSGLGLTFCKLAVQCHGGRIWIKSRLGEGATVFMALPLRQGGDAGAGRTGAAGNRAA